MKSFGPKPWVLPQPVLIIGTYNEDGTPNAMNAAWGGQWDAKEIMICMGTHATTENLARCADFTVAFATKDTMVASDFVGIASAKNDPQKMQKTGWTFVKAEDNLEFACKELTYDRAEKIALFKGDVVSIKVIRFYFVLFIGKTWKVHCCYCIRS